MRPMASTWVASMQNIAAPDSARLLMWVKCQSLAEPSSAEYWHIGDTMMRLDKVRPRRVIGVKSLLLGMIRGRDLRGNDGVILNGRRSLARTHAAYQGCFIPPV